LTGVTEFSGLSIFSGLNNCKDITFNKDFTDICGYTQAELENNLGGHINFLAKKKKLTYEQILEQIKYWYNGYTWDGKTAIYNPFSTLRLFRFNSFNNYWFYSGMPGFLSDYIKNDTVADLFFEKEKVDAMTLMTYNPQRTSSIALLFQAGYLTIKKKTGSGDNIGYLLASPNCEVEQSLAKQVLLHYVNDSDIDLKKIIDSKKRLINSIVNLKEKNFSSFCSNIMSKIPARNHNNNERFYHAVLFSAMEAMAFDVVSEKETNIGKLDIVWKYKNYVAIIEIKFIDSEDEKQIDKKIDEAIAQIKKKRYYEAYEQEGVNIILIGLVFTRQAEIVKSRFEVWK
jgi:hypothetical protein